MRSAYEQTSAYEQPKHHEYPAHTAKDGIYRSEDALSYFYPKYHAELCYRSKAG